ncbi:MAG: YkgJ family cysteine cluster protein [Candidatus Aenigmarchaeota archaeon]|nr:YkgJ family cysteine cluster protein [Candidatus Aenigmarchaeota archaeon]
MSEFSLLEECKKCGAKCCKSGTPILLPWERDKIVKETGRDVFEKAAKWYIFNKENGEPCPFLKNDLCTIEEIKPINCKAFPAVIFGGINPEKTVKTCPIKKLPMDFVENVDKLRKQLEMSLDRWKEYMDDCEKAL